MSAGATTGAGAGVVFIACTAATNDELASGCCREAGTMLTKNRATTAATPIAAAKRPAILNATERRSRSRVNSGGSRMTWGSSEWRRRFKHGTLQPGIEGICCRDGALGTFDGSTFDGLRLLAWLLDQGQPRSFRTSRAASAARSARDPAGSVDSAHSRNSYATPLTLNSGTRITLLPWLHETKEIKQPRASVREPACMLIELERPAES